MGLLMLESAQGVNISLSKLRVPGFGNKPWMLFASLIEDKFDEGE